MHNNERLKLERLYRFRLVMIALPTILGFLLWTNVELISELMYLNYRFVATVAAWLIAGGVGYFLMVYLKGGIKLPLIERFTDSMKPLPDVSEQTLTSNDELEQLKKKVSEISYAQIQLKEGQQEAIINELRGTVSEDLVAKFEADYADVALKKFQLSQAKEKFRKSIDRLSKEIDTLTRRANLNLVIGVLTTAIAVSLLTYMVLSNDTKLDTLTDLFSYYVPRVTVVIFIEVFSFFFLKMYKSNLSEIKFYQQEITKISTQQVIYESALVIQDNHVLSPFVQYSLDKSSDTSEVKDTESVNFKIEQLSKVAQETSKIIASLSKSNSK
ncbi:hypothetical protein LRL27_004738 [Vibrio alginolyticus]|uniref:hypothetical protein n=1 Tax=Vibrio alginolyticus TaxID=663 RepID=UPI000CE96E50|nr:hypothetical protein [Vibrio alginolyticus]AVF66041.1 hypothetical protein AL541_17625 [Vibrio alginolyticus]EIP0123045.1 hypothetical protein [Vibrio alginolyticus]